MSSNQDIDMVDEGIVAPPTIDESIPPTIDESIMDREPTQAGKDI